MFKWRNLLIIVIAGVFWLAVSTSTADKRIKYVVNKLPHNRTKTYSKRAVSKIQGVVIHHTAAASRTGFKEVKRIAAYHSRESGNHICSEGCPGIAYHFMLDKDGTIFQTNDLTTISYHAGAGNNTKTVGVCMLGNFESEYPTERQYSSLAWIIQYLANELGKNLDIIQHKDIRPTSCPGRNFDIDYLEQKLDIS